MLFPVALQLFDTTAASGADIGAFNGVGNTVASQSAVCCCCGPRRGHGD
jgi:hypothetical protein